MVPENIRRVLGRGNSRGKEANKKGVVKQDTNPSGELRGQCRICPSVVPLRGGEAGAFLHQLPICCWLRAAPGGMSSPAFLTWSPPRPNMLLGP